MRWYLVQIQTDGESGVDGGVQEERVAFGPQVGAQLGGQVLAGCLRRPPPLPPPCQESGRS